jgi:hypothetical protein
MSEEKQNLPEGQSRVYVLFYSFFLIPLMITVFGVMFFIIVKFLTFENTDPNEYLTQIKIGSASKRWQSAYELSKILSDPGKVPVDNQFRDRMLAAYEQSLHDDAKVRMYLALAMGRTGDEHYGVSLMNGLQDESLANRIATVQSLGLLQYEPAIEKLIQLVKSSEAQEMRLAATVALGQIGNDSSTKVLRILLEDEEPNIRWDAAIALAKMGDDSGAAIIEGLLDRQYYKNFNEIDDWETEKAIMVAIQISSQLKDVRFADDLKVLAQNDPNMKIRDAALKTLEKVYNMELNNG